MDDVAIRAEGIGKQYRIGKKGGRYRTLRETLTDAFVTPVRRAGELRHSHPASTVSEETIWALKEVSFEIKHGEVVGIIGRNGAGKSTLLKILSRITEPTRGYVDIHGRVGSLLEVGTGFHPELTGRENIYLNGAILGMRRAEIEHKFDEIVAFSEVEKFIDTPVKHYSSGMYLRLAFAVAAHLEPEILIVDEVLAVGDLAFQKKCLGKMGEVAKEGRTILLVSHNMTAVLGLCERAILLDAGRVVGDGANQKVVDQYMHTIEKVASQPLDARVDRKGNHVLKFVAFEMRNSEGLRISRARAGQDIVLAFSYESPTDKPLRNVHVSIGVRGKFDERLFNLSTTVNGFEFEEIPPRGTVLCNVRNLPLQPGRYTFNLYSEVGNEVADWIQNADTIEVEAGDFFGSGRLPSSNQGPFLVPHSWRVSAR